MKRTWISMIAIGLAGGMALSQPAQATEPYVGVGLGSFVLNDGVNRQDTFGGYLQLGDDFSPYLGGELRIGASAKTKEETVPVARPATQVDGFAAFFLKPKYTFAENWMGYGLIGLGTVRASYYPIGAAKQTKTRVGLGYGLGLQYRMADQYSLGAEWSHLLSRPSRSAGAAFQGLGVSMYTLSAKYHF